MDLAKKLREPMNGFTHFIGVILSIIGTILLINLTLNPFKPYHFISFLIFGLGMILLFATSTLYHWLKLSDNGVKKMRKADHIMIFIYIAATYTPICMIVLNKNLGWIVLTAVWSIAVAGILIKIYWMNAPRWLSTSIYILMGWLAVVIIYPLINALQIAALMWLLIGGIFYTIGAVIYALKRPDPFPGILGFHEIFHLFVLLGSFSHFWLIYNYITIIDVLK
jgi:hemolysin III